MYRHGCAVKCWLHYRVAERVSPFPVTDAQACATVAVREEEAAARVRQAEAAQAEAQERVARAEARAAAAEAAKIELSLKLADALSQQDSETDISAVPTPVTPRSAASRDPECHWNRTVPKQPLQCPGSVLFQ